MTIRFLSISLLLAALTGCGSVSVKTASQEDFRLASYHTFAFKKPAHDFDAQYFSQQNQQRVRAAVAEELAARGLSESQAPELWVGYFLRVRGKKFDLEHPTAEGDSMADVMKSHYGFMFGSGKTLNQQESIHYEEGTLIVDLVEAKSNRIVWQGVAKGAMHENESEDAVENRIREAIRKMFAGMQR